MTRRRFSIPLVSEWMAVPLVVILAIACVTLIIPRCNSLIFTSAVDGSRLPHAPVPIGWKCAACGSTDFTIDSSQHYVCGNCGKRSDTAH